MSDIVERLVRFAGKVCISTDTEVEAASEIERLRAENEKLRAELHDANEALTVAYLHGYSKASELSRAAAAALKGTRDE